MTSVHDPAGPDERVADDRGADSEPDSLLPRRRRRRRLGVAGTLAAGVLAAAIGLLVGIELEKPHVPSSSSSGASTARLNPTTFRLRAARSGFGAAGFGATGFGATGTGAAGAAGRAGLTTGTVVSVSGDSVVVRESSGSTVTVHILPTSTVTRATSVSQAAIDPGDTLILTGHAGAGASYVATAVTDSGSSSASTSSAG